MSTRQLRVNELIQRELSGILRKRYQEEAALITISGVSVTPDTREGKVFVSVTGDADFAQQKLRWLRKHAQELRFELGRTIVLKHMPVLTYQLDIATDRGNRILDLLDQIAGEEKSKTPPPAE
ncbi:ribosome-binding factor A [Opitutaceae bacterium TAV4]|uniref:ribosome-binding factor A n=1 Tax=Geminisphaera colitermitum TaxID=1148786 RepID=UPI0005B7A956|nr:ribosome-binding factor A [Geminisphaera colitermitum]RRJ95423.1 ribosome-binding factor A [Opitutaceae bacterium TAV4]RRJ99605.1 ribosome-binding factor A [Opitutaceae bacterium TAV3]